MSTRPIIYKYPLDLTGHQPNNLVIGEPQTLPTGRNRAIVPNYGAFYAASLVIRDAASGTTLVPRSQFMAVQLYQEATERTGLEVCAVVVITDPTVSSEVLIDYQAIGGEFSYSVSNLRDMLDSLDLDSRPVLWGDVVGRPGQFPPAPHLHDAGDLYGFEYLVESIDSLRHAIMVGQESALGELRQYITLVEGNVVELQARCISAETRLFNLENQNTFSNHIYTTNPHQLTANQLALDGLVNAPYLSLNSVIGTGQEFIEWLISGSETIEQDYLEHIGNRLVHEETADTFGLLNVQNGSYMQLATTAIMANDLVATY
jgi:hypothetical protein